MPKILESLLARIAGKQGGVVARIEIRRFSRVKTCLGQVFVHASLIGAARAAALPPQSAALKGRTAARPMMFQPSQSAILSQPRRT